MCVVSPLGVRGARKNQNENRYYIKATSIA